ncbi:MAG: transcriptional regulator, PadR-like family protein [Paenibacillus sp.]|jgi:DNA-binding PadR family transcriptional regulator|uniref:Helix-turn-helix transcriptional regulator n=1 Tax=Paenibacillus hemerocallicola TaxID=1172614 RepID=A0A5C4T0D4_9BACL|nr:PadR family transcriptional regulator [Paenibacillus hemerocallicola]MDF2658139.1 transcriptional regulator, PadR-like family protein [Paenibacillus sp.]TNJ62245.1 helix-turn-helix transcriptional regulator [Paenibacillus hemerocallicola]
MYEIFVLGELTVGDRHGYILQEILKSALGPFRQISAGTLYPLLSRLVEDGFIELRPESGSSGSRPRKLYAITESGRIRFRQLMEAPLEFQADTEILFQFKTVYFRYVSKEARLACMEQYLTYAQYKLKHVTDREFQLHMQRPEPEKQRAQLLRVLDYRKQIGAAEIEWVKQEIERMKAAAD